MKTPVVLESGSSEGQRNVLMRYWATRKLIALFHHPELAAAGGVVLKIHQPYGLSTRKLIALFHHPELAAAGGLFSKYTNPTVCP